MGKENDREMRTSSIILGSDLLPFYLVGAKNVFRSKNRVIKSLMINIQHVSIAVCSIVLNVAMEVNTKILKTKDI